MSVYRLRAPLSLIHDNLISTLIARRHRRELSQQDLALIMETSRQFVQELESNGKHPSLGTTIKWARALGMQVRLIDMEGS